MSTSAVKQFLSNDTKPNDYPTKPTKQRAQEASGDQNKDASAPTNEKNMPNIDAKKQKTLKDLTLIILVSTKEVDRDCSE